MSEIAVVILSGGIDSTTLCYKLKNEGYDVYPLTFLYGQKHSKEILSAKDICKRLKVTHKITDISNIGELLSGSALTDDNVKIPEVPETVDYYETLKSTIVPNRNAILLSIATGYAQSLGANKVFFGAHHSDRGVYPDCRKEFVEAFQGAERIANDNPSLSILSPFVDLNKSEVVKIGKELDVPYELTWSCYAGEDIHCGTCSSCRERKRAFSDNNLNDPTIYAD